MIDIDYIRPMNKIYELKLLRKNMFNKLFNLGGTVLYLLECSITTTSMEPFYKIMLLFENCYFY